MAGAIPKRSGIQRMLECPVCLSQFNCKDRIPKALSCHHTFCALCVHHLAEGNKLLCPKCRKETLAEAVGTNYMLTDILDALCEECFTQDREVKCEHCDQNFCASCLDSHNRILQQAIRNDLDKLQQELSVCIEHSKDPQPIKQIHDGNDAILSQIKSTFMIYHKTLEEYEKKLIAQASHISDQNIKTHVNWREKLDSQVTRVKSFIDQTCGKIGGRFSEISISNLCELQSECSKLLKELVEIKSSQINLVHICFASRDRVLENMSNYLGQVLKKDNLIDTGSNFNEMDERQNSSDYNQDNSISVPSQECSYRDASGILCSAESFQAASHHEQPSPSSLPSLPHKQAVMKNKDVKDTEPIQSVLVHEGPSVSSLPSQSHKQVSQVEVESNDTKPTAESQLVRYYGINRISSSVGVKGEEGGQFNEPWGICQTYNGDLLVTDKRGHRIQVFDRDLQFLRNFGEHGSGRQQFQCPTGITTNNQNDVFISDFHNDRIQVYSYSGRFLCTFGKYGNRDGCLQGPLGIDWNRYGNNLYVCDSGNLRIQVFTCDGGFVRKFGPNQYNKTLKRPLFNRQPIVVKVTYSRKVLVGECCEPSEGTGIHVFSLEGDYLQLFPTVWQGSLLTYIQPNGITEDSQGNILATDVRGVIKVYKDNGAFIWEIRLQHSLKDPHGITTDAEGNILVCDTGNHRVVKIDASKN